MRAQNEGYVLYVHDHKFVRCRSGVWSPGNFSDKVFARYEPFQRHVVVMSRMIRGEPDGCSRIGEEAVSFRPVKGLHFSEILTSNLLVNLRLITTLVWRADVVVLRLPSVLGTLVGISAKLLRKPVFVELVGDPYEALVGSRVSSSKVVVGARLFEMLTRKIIRYSTGVIYVTAQTLQRKFPTQGFSAAASNVELAFDVPPRAKSVLFGAGEQVVIGSIASFATPYKGVDVGIRAVAQLRERGVDCMYRVLGAGDKEYYLSMAKELGVDDLVHFDGVRAHGQEVAGWLDELDIYIQPSRTEGLPRALVEAMSRGLPCVATSVGGMPELLPVEMLVDPGDALALAARIIWLTTNEERMRAQSKRNLAIAEAFRPFALSVVRSNFWNRAASVVNSGK